MVPNNPNPGGTPDNGAKKTTTAAAPTTPPAATNTGSSTSSLMTSSTTLSDLAINVVETNQGYIVGAILLSLGLIGMVASMGMAIMRYKKDKGTMYAKTSSSSSSV